MLSYVLKVFQVQFIWHKYQFMKRMDTFNNQKFQMLDFTEHIQPLLKVVAETNKKVVHKLNMRWNVCVV